jgi:hypothetical protein
MINSYKLETVTITPRTKSARGNISDGTPFTHSFFIERKLIYERGSNNVNFLKGRAMLKTTDDVTIGDLDLINFDNTNFRFVESNTKRSWSHKVYEIMVV